MDEVFQRLYVSRSVSLAEAYRWQKQRTVRDEH